MNQGKFSSGGAFATSKEDIDALFSETLVEALEAAQADSRPLRLLFYAHGGLVSEKNGLRRAHKDIAWWKRNGVYPLYFVWETGLFEVIGQLLKNVSSKTRGARDVWDYTADPVVESLARALGGPTLWAGMKRSAASAAAPGGGARYVAERLGAFLKKHAAGRGKPTGAVELHALGHSAGSNFHSFFLPALVQKTGAKVKTLHLLAPAVSVEVFLGQLEPLLGKSILSTVLYTMKKDLERSDNCAHLYHKSLLYLIYHALETEKRTPILGLEESVRADATLQKLLGLNGKTSERGEAVWSVSASDSGRSASLARSHVAFNDDPATMNSVLRRVVGAGDSDPIVPFPGAETRGLDRWGDGFDWPEGLGERPAERPIAPPPALNSSSGSADTLAEPTPPLGTSNPPRRRALCVGIDHYPDPHYALAGCVADAELWAETLTELGFAATRLLNEQATRKGILEGLEGLISSSRPGDVLVFQYAGHGTQLPDESGDEAGDTVDINTADINTADKDEALCAYDFASGAFVIDDDLRELFDRLPTGVNLTCFLDCCHSGSATRLMVGRPAGQRGVDERPRFLRVKREMVEAHRRFRYGRGGRTQSRSRAPGEMRNVAFSACRSSEVAWESDGQGDFTKRATALLRNVTQKNATGLSNKDFAEQVLSAFGSRPRQHPELDCAPEYEVLGLLQPVAEADAFEEYPPETFTNETSNVNTSVDTASVALRLRQLAHELEAGL